MNSWQDKNTTPVDLAAYARRTSRRRDSTFDRDGSFEDDELATAPIDLASYASSEHENRLPSATLKAAIPDARAVMPSLLDITIEFDDGSEDAEEDARDDVAVAIGPAPSLNHVPFFRISQADLGWYDLDATSSVIVGQIDGRTSVQALVGRVGMPWKTVLDVLGQLTLHGIVGFR